MNRCPITYESCGRDRYSRRGLNLLSKGLIHLKDFPYTAQEQRDEAIARAAKMSIQGVQPKLSVRLKATEGTFEVVDAGGRYILKPQNLLFCEVPENEDLTMRLAKSVGIEVPFHGLIYSKDGSMTYLIKRFDRAGRNTKLPIEDFAQLSGATRNTKYDSSMERVASTLDRCTFPVIERLKLFRLNLFNYLTGNEDMHLKNFSLITRSSKVELSPAYDLVNTTIILPDPQEELALPLQGKKRNLTRQDLVDYFGGERLQLNRPTRDSVLEAFKSSFSEWERLIAASFLSDDLKQAYLDLVGERRAILGV